MATESKQQSTDPKYTDSQCIIKTFTDEPSDKSDNLKKTADCLYFEGKNGHISYSLPLNKFSVHYECDDKHNPCAYIGLHIIICYSSKDSRPIFVSINNRICEGALCEDIIGDFDIKTAQNKVYGPFVIDINDNEKDNEFVNITFTTSGYFPHIKEFKFVPVAIYNLSNKQQIYRAINWNKLIQLNDSEHHDLDIRIVDAIKRRSLHKTKSYQNFTSNILFYADGSNKSIKPHRMSDNMSFDDKYIKCDGKNGFIEYVATIKRHDRPSLIKTYDHEFKLTLGIEYSSPNSRPLQVFINDECKLKNICDETIKESYDEAAAWRIHNISVNSKSCTLRINTLTDKYEFTLKLQTEGLFPNIKSIMLMEDSPIKFVVETAQSDSSLLDESEKKNIPKDKPKDETKDNDNDNDTIPSDKSESFLKLATHYREFITPPSDLISFEPFISSVKNICFDTYFTGLPYTKITEDEKKDKNNQDKEKKDDNKDESYPDIGITLNNEIFIPDHTFYESRNVDGLWICVSKKCDNVEQILEEATFLVKSFIPIEIRRLFLKYKHGRYRPKYVGPMRLIILSHKHNEQAGQIPELKTKETGRNGTAQPFVFSSSDDYNRGFFHNQWFNGRLTAHELVHAVDMVIRQLIDPCFMAELDKIYNLAKNSKMYPGKCYAMTSRHEYFAEILTVFLNIPPYDLYSGGFKNKDDLKEKDIEGYKFLQKWFLELNHSLPVLDVYKKFSGTL